MIHMEILEGNKIMKRKLLAVLLAMSMVFVPAAVSAEENTRTTEDNIHDMKT